MALTINENPEAGGGGQKVTADRRLCLDAAGQICEAGTKESVSLYAGEGKQVSRADFEARGGKGGVRIPVVVDVVVEAAEPVKEDEPKPAPKPRRKRKRKTTKKGK